MDSSRWYRLRALFLLLVVVALLSACSPMSRPYVEPQDEFSQEPAGSYETSSFNGLPLAKPTGIVRLADGDKFTLTAEKVRKEIAGRDIVMYGYNGMIPGPIFVAEQGSSANITFVNNLDKDTTVHWHGLRGDYRSDGVPGLGQDVVKPGESFTYNLVFPDDGVFWYHPHVREDAQQDLGLYGNIFVSGLENVAGKADREEYLVLDDIALSESGVVPFGKDVATHAIMGRYGNVLLVNGEPEYELEVRAGEVVRLYFTNVANVRPFMIQIPNARVKLVGGDNGAYLKQEFVENIVIAPAERYVVDVVFDKAGTYELRADNPLAKHLLGKFIVSEGAATAAGKSFDILQMNKQLQSDVTGLEAVINGPVDRTLELDFRLPGMPGMGMMQDTHDGIEWEDTMPMMSSFTSDRIDWVIRDKESGKENSNLTIKAKVGDVEKWRINNLADSMHPMQHPIHLHGQRFLITAIDGQKVDNPVWKDVVLVPVGHNVDLVVEYTNAGEWMLHCHIAEHLETGMFAYVSVADKNGVTSPRIGAEMH